MKLKSKYLIITLPLIAVLLVQTTVSSNFLAPQQSIAQGDNFTSSNSLGSSSSSSTTHIDAKNTQQAIYSCAQGDKGVIIPPGNFNMVANKKAGKWSGYISIKGTPGEKSGSITSGSLNKISYTFKGNLNTKNTLCHFPGLLMGGTAFQIGSFTCGTIKNVAYTELSTGNTNTFKVRINCR